MKARPRRYENRIASILSDYFTRMGASPVERIPVNGKRGPDITPNELGLIIDCKTRIGVPESILVDKPTCFNGVYVASPLFLFPNIEPQVVLPFFSKVVVRFLEHVEEACKDDEIPMLVLNKPNRRAAKSVFVISKTYLDLFIKRMEEYERVSYS